MGGVGGWGGDNQLMSELLCWYSLAGFETWLGKAPFILFVLFLFFAKQL